MLSRLVGTVVIANDDLKSKIVLLPENTLQGLFNAFFMVIGEHENAYFNRVVFVHVMFTEYVCTFTAGAIIPAREKSYLFRDFPGQYHRYFTYGRRKRF